MRVPTYLYKIKETKKILVLFTYNVLLLLFIYIFTYVRPNINRNMVVSVFFIKNYKKERKIPPYPGTSVLTDPRYFRYYIGTESQVVVEERYFSLRDLTQPPR